MTTRRQRMFEDLGLLTEAEPVNPYQTLGLDPDFAAQLLREDYSGAVLRTIAGGLHRILARRYHPDIPKTGDENRWREISDANERIENASAASLTRWTKTERAARSVKLDKLLENREQVVERAATLLQADLELGSHPKHFSQLPWAQGILLERNSRPLLMRPLEKGGVRIVQGVSTDKGRGEIPLDVKEHAFDLSTLLKQHDSFGLEPGAPITTYVDERGRTTVMSQDLTFLMDITEPVRAYRQKREEFNQEQLSAIANSDFWLRANAPVLFTTFVPDSNHTRPDGTITIFPDNYGNKDSGRSMIWDIELEPAGSLTDLTYFKQVRHARNVGNQAIQAAQSAQGHSYFNMFAFQTRQLVEEDTGYTPLLDQGNSLLLYEPQLRMPVATDAKLVGMIGSNAGGS